jgi:predicted amidophosphoribosyltransferase
MRSKRGVSQEKGLDMTEPPVGSLHCCISCGRDTRHQDGFCEMCRQDIEDEQDTAFCPDCNEPADQCICYFGWIPESWACKSLLEQQGYDESE